MIQARDLTLSFGSQAVFSSISFIINGHEKIGLAGRNGAGKTTLLKMIAGLQFPDSGTISIRPGFTVAYLPQEVILTSQKNVLIEALNTFNGLGDRLDEVQKKEAQLGGNGGHGGNGGDGGDVVALRQHLYDEDCDGRIQEASVVLRGLGFSQADLLVSVDTLSTGWKMRLVLAKLLLQKADFYLFDEPTNHLDLTAQDWFFEFLLRAKSGYLLVSHNRYFLDHACSTIYELSFGALTIYKGNYTFYLEQKAQRQELLERQYFEQQKFIQKQTAIIERFRASASKASTVQSMIKSLEKLDPIKLDPLPKPVRFHFPPVIASGKQVLSLENISCEFEGREIFKNVSFSLARGHKVALIAPNGTGKSTLLKIIAGVLPPKTGTITLGHQVSVAFFEQDQNRSLDQEKTVYDTAVEVCKTSEDRQRVRIFLGAFLFSGDDIKKKVGVLSGGEKNRVAMVRVLLQKANFLLLDEPTNHLDVQAKEVLLQALKQYQGTVLFVSHDRDFLNKLATDIVELSPTGSWNYPGTYDEFLYAKKHEQTPVQKTVAATNTSVSAVSSVEDAIEGEQAFRARKRMKALESAIARLENERKDLLHRFETIIFNSPEYYEASQRLKKIDKQLAEQTIEWEQVAAQLLR